MSGTQMNDESKRDWIRVLENLRFDITRHEPLQAHKEYGEQRAVDVSLDESGQVRMIVTRKMSDTQRERRTSRAGRAYLVFVEQNAVTIVNYRLRGEDDLMAVLTEMEKEIA
jgi:uncharacterized protein YacL (UPF0231 family)